jgi:predicted transcriptional regulator of viral defense system
MTVAQAIQAIGRPVFTTREIAGIRSASLSSTSQSLTRMAELGLVTAVSRGLWCLPSDPRFTPFALVPFLSGRHRAYVSFFSALHLLGLTGQIPQVVYAATTAHTRVATTRVGKYSFHRMQPALFAGFDWHSSGQFLIATPEKAVVDCLYLSGRKGKRFGFLPELELPRDFSFRRARSWAARIAEPNLRGHVLEKLKDVESRYGSSARSIRNVFHPIRHK